jgi:hypothetical protein
MASRIRIDFNITTGRAKKSHRSQLLESVENLLRLCFIDGNITISIWFLLNDPFILNGLRLLGRSIQVHTSFSYMDLIADFIASSHFLDFEITIRRSTCPSQPRGRIIVWSFMIIINNFLNSWCGVRGNIFCVSPVSNSREGSITSSSSTFLPPNSFERNSFSRKDPFLAT